jgi:hypothetical protein
VNGTYTVTPTKSGFTFTPPNQTVTVNGANVSNVGFTAVQSVATIAIDAAVSTDRSGVGSTIASPGFSTTATNELLLALVSADNNTSASTTVTGVTGAGLTWVLVGRTNVQRGSAEIWRAFAPALLTGVTATAALSQNVPASITVMTFKGVDTSGTNGSGAIGAVGSGNANPGAPSATLVTTRNNSLVIGVGTDWDNAVARTAAANQTIVHQYLATIGDTYWVQRTTNPVPTSGTTVSISDTAPTTDRYDLTICEILPLP